MYLCMYIYIYIYIYYVSIWQLIKYRYTQSMEDIKF